MHTAPGVAGAVPNQSLPSPHAQCFACPQAVRPSPASRAALQFEKAFPDKDAQLCVGCLSGKRSIAACNILQVCWTGEGRPLPGPALPQLLMPAQALVALPAALLQPHTTRTLRHRAALPCHWPLAGLVCLTCAACSAVPAGGWLI